LEKALKKLNTEGQSKSLRDIPYTTYINSYNKAHILLDQTYAYDQATLEAMEGRSGFTGRNIY
jgi:hypothetical protein